jgi:hypothetical protein
MVLLVMCLAAGAHAESPSALAAVSAAQSSGTSQTSPLPIADNSFLIEEAYNQEAGVVQHISFLTYSPGSEDWVYTFTQEWPVPGDSRHQFSYTLPVIAPSAGAGLGDFAPNYRYQLIGDGDAPLAVSPRLSLLLPTGKTEVGRGLGGVSVQANFPASVRLAPRWVMHANVGGTITPSAENELGEEASVSAFNLGHSLIWLAHSRFNVLLETSWIGQGFVARQDQAGFSHGLFINPAVRWAHTFTNGLQIIPGLGYAFGIGPSSGDRSVLFYLSLEHPFGRDR